MLPAGTRCPASSSGVGKLPVHPLETLHETIIDRRHQIETFFSRLLARRHAERAELVHAEYGLATSQASSASRLR